MRNSKKVLMLAIMMVMFCILSTTIYAAGYTFEFQYSGDITQNVEKGAAVLLIGDNGPTYTNVRVNVEITGPATPEIIAYDSNGTKIDIVQVGYWGPPTGFAVQGTFTNTTPVVTKFSQPGTYTITLSLVDINNNSAVIATKTETINVLATPVIENVVNNTNVTELPQTGASIWDYAIYTIVIIAILTFGYILIRRNKQKA